MLARVRDPRGAGRWPAAEPGVCTGEAGAADEGILIRLQVRRADRAELPGDPRARVQEARFQAFGCPVAIACASWLAEWAGGKSLAEIEALPAAELCRALELQPGDAPTAELALTALRGALAPLPAPPPPRRSRPNNPATE